MLRSLLFLTLQLISFSVYGQSASSYQIKRVFWFAPNAVNEINGLTVGIWPENIKHDKYPYEIRDTLKINGLYIEINPLRFLAMVTKNEYPDSIEYYKNVVKNSYKTTVNGFIISGIGTVGKYRMRGLYLGGINTLFSEASGLIISGLNNGTYDLKGVQISLIRNQATIARGLQIGLINKSSDLRGMQVGLWNINGKRKLPIINWQFTPGKSSYSR